ncbi:hypothetical protein E4U41_007503 [Claviceps citrina]|nr:hypothetical protein E4U41_007503 [Claviceps citrina]
MALQQPTWHAASRVARVVAIQDGSLPRPSPEREPEGSQTWVLFSPPTDVTTTTYLTESEHSLETPGRSRLSELGSLNTVARSEEAANARSPSVLSVVDDQEGDDDAELDSLDSHLADFRSVPGLNSPPQRGQHASPVFPSHDGLGSFRLDRPVIGPDAQDQIYDFERFNPRKIRRRLDSFDHTLLTLGDVLPQQEEKRQRIEAWRLEHSRTLADELQRETKRRQKSLASMHRSKGSTAAEADNLSWHDEDAIQTHTNDNQESLVARITRKIVREFLGIDDAMLSILLGEELPADGEGPLLSVPRGSQAEAQHILTHTVSTDPSSWQLRIIERVSRELGFLVHHLSPHPGAFITHTVMQSMALPHAGSPVIPETGDAGMAGLGTEHEKTCPAVVPEFQPTLNGQSQPMDVPRRKLGGDDEAEDVDMAGGHFSKDEWEKSLDINLVLRYLVSRFTSRSNTSPQSSATHQTTPTQQENAAKVARIRQHHPLVARTRPLERPRSFKAVAPTSPVGLRHQSSCASHSTKHSARRSSCSSRHYWDIGGSLGTGSVMASNGPMGSWGEV